MRIVKYLLLIAAFLSFSIKINQFFSQKENSVDMEQSDLLAKGDKVDFKDYVKGDTFDYKAYVKAQKDRDDARTQSYEDKNTWPTVSSFDTEATNFERFEQSPCYNKIGFDPAWDIENLEESYSDCENEIYIKTSFNVLYILAFIIIIGIVIYYSKQKKK